MVKKNLLVAALTTLAVMFFSSSTVFAVENNTAMHKSKKKLVAEQVSPHSVSSQNNQNPEAINLEQKNLEKQDLKKRVKLLEDRLNKLTQNRDNPKPLANWYKKLGVSGMVAVDTYRKTNPGESGASLYVAALNLDSKANDWVSGHLGLLYSDAGDGYYANASTKTNVDVNEAYISIKNLKSSPFYLRLGRQYLPFDNYFMHPVVMPLTQRLAETRETALQLGFVDQSGFSGSIYAFKGLPKYNETSKTYNFNDFGVALEYSNKTHPWNFNLGAGYLNNMANTGMVADSISHRAEKGYHNRVGGLSLYLDLISGQFNVGGHYVSALRRFSASDVSFTKDALTRGARSSAAMLTTGYKFKIMDKTSKVNLFYNWTNEAYSSSELSSIPFQLPKNDLGVAYGVNVLQHVILVFRYDLQHTYPHRNGGSGKRVNVIQVRVNVLF